MPSFDVVFEPNHHERMNAIDQVRRKLVSHFDCRGVDRKITLDQKEIVLESVSQHQVRATLYILRPKVAKRGIDQLVSDVKDPEVDVARSR